MRILICVDDTDDLTKTTSTGTIAELIEKEIKKLGGITELGITRHQLLLHEDIAYTSHNSSMCFPADIDKELYEQVCNTAEKVLLDNIVPSACPGLCICIPEKVTSPEELIAFGCRAKKEVIKKEEAYNLANKLGGISLTEHGNTGAGIIGALAGIGLRLSGWDGTFRGKLKMKNGEKVISAKDFCDETGVSQVLNLDGSPISMSTIINIDKFAKAVLWNGEKTILADSQNRICQKSDLFNPDNSLIEGIWKQECPDFILDNDHEERLTEQENSCANCLYRRWTSKGFCCVK
ncbi:hypothetical protein [Anaerovorax odorimutans]|uniref:hypothetical protein n=1 Tax=Anaerovorax odorimutans TaxID=109327 RepID=UPI0004142429|nr:hypothetical protein [Anaerovorax odorimutans]